MWDDGGYKQHAGGTLRGEPALAAERLTPSLQSPIRKYLRSQHSSWEAIVLYYINTKCDITNNAMSEAKSTFPSAAQDRKAADNDN